jgi:hypothetical protein
VSAESTLVSKQGVELFGGRGERSYERRVIVPRSESSCLSKNLVIFGHWEGKRGSTTTNFLVVSRS